MASRTREIVKALRYAAVERAANERARAKIADIEARLLNNQINPPPQKPTGGGR